MRVASIRLLLLGVLLCAGSSIAAAEATAGGAKPAATTPEAAPGKESAKPRQKAKPPEKKYGVKSGVITFDHTLTHEGTKQQQKIVVTFDDWGNKERKDTYTGTELVVSNMNDGKTYYVIKPPKKMAWIRPLKGRGTEMRFDWDAIPAREKEASRAQQRAPMEIVGKKCEAYVQDPGPGQNVFAGWKNVLLYHESNIPPATRHVIKAQEFKVDVRIPPSTFEIPPGFTIEKTDF